MRTTGMLLCALLVALPAIALAQRPGETTPPPSGATAPKEPSGETAKLSQVDTQAIAHQHAVNQLEIDLGKLAQKNGSAKVKDYGKTLASDHMKADREITAFAKKHGVTTIPADQAMTDQDKKQQADNMSKLRAMKGADFDKEFLNMMVTDHEREVTKAEADIGIVDNKDLANHLRDNVKPMLQRHADNARKLQQEGATTSMKER